MKKSILIIGGGMSGLSAGIYGLKNGYDVTILEKNNTVGGYCTTWRRDEVTIDSCIHWITGCKSDEIKNIYDEIGVFDKGHILHNPYFVIFKDNDNEIIAYRDINKFKDELLKYATENDKVLIEKLIKLMDGIKHVPVTASLPEEIMTEEDQKEALSKMMPAMMSYLRLTRISMKDYAEKYESATLKHFFTCFMPEKYPLYYFIGTLAKFMNSNADVVDITSQDFAINAKNKFVELGGNIIYNSEVDKLEFDNHKIISVTDKKGNSYRSDIIINTSSLPYFYEKLLPKEYHDQKVEDIIYDHENVDNYTAYYAIFTLDKDYPHEVPNYIIYHLENGFKCMSSTNLSIGFKGYSYLKNKDGSTTFVALIDQNETDYFMWKKAKEEGTYYQLKRKYAEELENILIERNPDMKSHLKLLDTVTPLTFERWVNGYHGIFQDCLPLSNKKRPNISNKAKGIDNLYYGGIWTQAIGGLPVAIISGKFAIDTLVYNEKNSKLD
jgi:phytoene dehydrogenase-like protein